MEFPWQFAVNGGRLTRERVFELKGGSMQQQAMTIRAVAEKPVVCTVSIAGIANHRVENVFQVAPDLVLTACFRIQPDQAVPVCREFPKSFRQLVPNNQLKFRYCWLWQSPATLFPSVRLVCKGIVKDPVYRNPAPAH